METFLIVIFVIWFATTDIGWGLIKQARESEVLQEVNRQIYAGFIGFKNFVVRWFTH
ncbi:hypothetical protein KAR91_16055 [Candidatus Pacearchaeota archaeon]|nr:hypothetical protein [Candidatus Pacearchaeota archaeon]